MKIENSQRDFDLRLAVECASAYSASSGIGCTVSDPAGRVLFEAGAGCASCRACEAAGLDGERCTRAQAYGMTSAERFGGRYIYFCPMGLTCFVSPIMGQAASAAKITAGPFLMVDAQDYVECDLKTRLALDGAAVARVLSATAGLPFIPAEKVNPLSVLLFMSVGFVNNIAQSSRLLDVSASEAIQGQITEYIMALKADGEPREYPFKTEKAMLASIADSDKASAQRSLNELLGNILLASGGNFSEIKSRIYELLALMSRAAVDAGAPGSEALRMNHEFYQKAAATPDIDELCFLLTDLMNKYIDSLFAFGETKNADVMQKALQYMRRNCTKKTSLEEVAEAVFLSPAYFGKLFKRELGIGFNTYLNGLRIEKSKRLLLQSDLPLVTIAAHSGFEDQSYFTKVFRRVTGMSPNQFRKSAGRGAL